LDGRKPTPPELRRQRGETHRARDIPILIAGRSIPRMPPGLNPRMQTVWRMVVRDLAAAQVLDRADWPVVEAFCVSVARAREARALLARSPAGLLTVNSQGVVAHPALAIEERAWKEVRQLAEQLPLSPLGRARLGLHGGSDPADTLEHDLGPARLTALK
jgi:P27 family predicted phage terminase small subunit